MRSNLQLASYRENVCFNWQISLHKSVLHSYQTNNNLDRTSPRLFINPTILVSQGGAG